MPAREAASELASVLHNTSDLDQGYFAALRNAAENSEAEEAIEEDLHRTFPEHPLFGGVLWRAMLKSVLVAYARRNREVGYSRGMNLVAAHFLLVCSEHDAFWLLTTVIEQLLPTGYYSSPMEGLCCEMRVLDTLLATMLPELHKHMLHLELPTEMIVHEWMNCLFVGTLPTETGCV